MSAGARAQLTTFMRELGLSKHVGMLQQEELDMETMKMMSEEDFKELVSSMRR